MSEVKNIIGHSLRYEQGKLFLTGVKNVDSFDDKTAELRLADSLLTLRGSGFKLEETEVKSGILTMEGKLTSLGYRDKAEKMSLIKRLFK